MKMIQSILLMTIVFLPALSLAHEHNRDRSQRCCKMWPHNNTQYCYSDYYDYEDRYYNRRPHNKSHKNQRKIRKIRKRKYGQLAKSGWNVTPRIAKRSPNCHRYTLSAYGGKGSARITSISGKNYIQVEGQRSGYVCFQGAPTLELGKLGNPNIRVEFNLEGGRSYAFGRRKTGSKYKNNWYRSYWAL